MGTCRKGGNLVGGKGSVHKLSKLLGESPQGHNCSVVPLSSVYDLLQ